MRPTLLSAHQNFDPIDDSSLEDWKYEAWSGEIAEEKVWRRSSFNAKHTLVSIFESIEALINAGFEPTRTLLLSFGFDEEIGGRKGATTLAEAVSERYEDGAAIIIDEGCVQHSGGEMC